MKEQIIRLLHETEGYVSGQELCDRFGVSRTAVWKVINQIKEDGYEIESVTRKGYRLVEAPDKVTAEEIQAALEKLAGGNGAALVERLSKIVYYESCDSTNTRAVALAEEGYPSGTLVVCNQQTAGKGRRGRSWNSPAGENIAMTLMLKPEIAPNNASMLTLVTALALVKAMQQCIGQQGTMQQCTEQQGAEQQCIEQQGAEKRDEQSRGGDEKGQFAIKWPNDIVMNGRKICGILTEMSMQMDYINHLVIGIGINVSGTEFSEEIRATAGSILTEAGVRVKRADLIAHFLVAFEESHQTFLATEDFRALREEYNAHLVNKNQVVRVLDPKGEYSGIAQGINERGELLVKEETTKEIKTVSSGEVSVRGIYGYV